MFTGAWRREIVLRVADGAEYWDARLEESAADGRSSGLEARVRIGHRTVSGAFSYDES